MSKKEKNLFDEVNFGDLVSTDGELDISKTDLEDKESEVENNSNDEEEEEDESKIDLNDFSDVLRNNEDDVGSNDNAYDEENLNEDKSTSVEDESEDDDKTTNELEDKKDETSTSSALTNALAIAKAFNEEGGLTSFNEEEFIKLAKEESPAKALIQMLKSEVEANISEYKESLDPDKKLAFEANELGINAQELASIQEDIKILNNITEETLDNPEARDTLLRYYYKNTTKFSDEKIEKKIKLLEDLDTAKEEVLEAIPELISIKENELTSKKEEAKTLKEKELEKEKNLMNKYKEYVDSTSEIIPGVKINKQTKNKIIDLINTPKKKDSKGKLLNGIAAKRLEDPIKFDTILGYLILEGAFDGKFNFNAKNAKNKAFTELEESLRTSRKSSSSSSYSNFGRSTGFKDSIKEMEKLK